MGMTNPLPPITQKKSVVISTLASLFFLAYKIVDAIGNADFLLQKLGFSEGAAKFLGSSRTIDVMIALSFGALVISLVYQVNRLMVTAESTSQQDASTTSSRAELDVSASGGKGDVAATQPIITTEPIAKAERIFTNVTPEYLTGFFNEHTDIQAGRLLEAYTGKWLEVSGIIFDVRTTYNGLSVGIDIGKAVPHVVAYFREKRWIDRAEILRKGDTSVVIGRIDRVTYTSVTLEECEIVADSTDV